MRKNPVSSALFVLMAIAIGLHIIGWDMASPLIFPLMLAFIVIGFFNMFYRFTRWHWKFHDRMGRRR